MLHYAIESRLSYDLNFQRMIIAFGNVFSSLYVVRPVEKSNNDPLRAILVIISLDFRFLSCEMQVAQYIVIHDTQNIKKISDLIKRFFGRKVSDSETLLHFQTTTYATASFYR